MRERLYRSRTDRVLFGVAGGMADWLDVDPSVVRLVWALLVLFGGAGLLLYIVAAIVIPEEPYDYVMPGPMPGAMPPGAVSGSVPGGASPGEPGAAPADAAMGGGAGPGGSGTAPAWASYADARAARRAARVARRAERGGNAGIIFGIILILVGAWFLAKDALPWLDDRWFGPGILVLIGALLLVAALRRPAPPTPPHA